MKIIVIILYKRHISHRTKKGRAEIKIKKNLWAINISIVTRICKFVVVLWERVGEGYRAGHCIVVKTLRL